MVYKLFLNDRLISHSTNISMVSHLIHDSEEILSSERSMRLIYGDTAGSMNANAANVPNFHKLIAGNNGLHCRYSHTRQGQEVMLTGG